MIHFSATMSSDSSTSWRCGSSGAKELERGPVWGLSHLFLVLQLSADGHDNLVSADPGQCVLRLSKGTLHTCLELRPGTPGCPT